MLICFAPISAIRQLAEVDNGYLPAMASAPVVQRIEQSRPKG